MTSDSDSPVSRFDAQPTRWSMIQRAHGATLSSGAAARQYLVMRYAAPIRAYVQAITRDEQQADDLTQDVIVRLLQGDFAGADPGRGRFRDLLKTAIRNMVRNHWAKQNVRRSVDYELNDVSSAAADEADVAWQETWQQQLLDLAWARLQEYQADHAGSVAYTVLKIRTEFPDANSEELADRLAAVLGKPVKSAQFRQQLRRARVRFAEYLVAEVSDCLDAATPAAIQEELGQLGLLDRVRDVLPEDWTAAS